MLIDSIREVAAQAIPAPAAPVSSEEALARLDRLPLDHVPEPQMLPSPHRMPLHPNQHFVGRDEELRALAALLKTGGTIAITTGIGGMGKTQLAAELVHRYGAYFAGGVFWVSCGNPTNIPAEVAECGQLMERSLAGLDQETQVRLTRAAWQEPIPRLVVFDNCEDERLLREWQPTTGGCRVLVTSRRVNWNTSLKVQTLPLAVLPRADSVKLLQQLAPNLAKDEEGAGKIAEALGDLPLALHLAGSYLARYRIPVDQYLDKLDKVRFIPHPSLQGRGVGDWPTDREPHIEKAFALSFERLNPDDPIDDLARRLLARAACFAPGERFGRSWLEATITPESDEEEQEQALARTDAVERLLGLGLLESVGEGGMRLHRLLAAYAALALSDAEALLAVEQVVSRVAYLANETRVPQAMLLVLPHLRHLVQQAGGREDEDVATLCTNLGFYLNAQGSYDAARPLYERALAIRERVLGADHPDTATSLNNLAVLHANQSQFALALPLLERAIRIRQARLGSQHPDTVQAQQSFVAMRRDAVVAALPEAVRAALQAQDGAAFQQALQALSPEQAQEVIQQLQAVFPPDDPLEQFIPLLQAIAAVAQGDNGPRTEVEAALAQLEQRGFHLTAAVQAIWSGQRERAALTAGLDDTDTALIGRVLALLEQAEKAKQRADLLARAEVAVAAAGDDPEARAVLAEKLLTVAASYASGTPEDWELAAQLQALAEQIRE
ncbi:MAG TPA: tetratricopeptide repeat protein [Roseiflexaceae bacterium]|nr:tetratricopeptide repeat protein [Roseiflexaceae bacterium]